MLCYEYKIMEVYHNVKIFKKILIIVAIVLAALITLLLLIKAGERIIYSGFYSKADREFTIPGLNDNCVPQGFDYIAEKESFLMCGYMSDDTASRVYLIDKDGKATYAEMKEEDGSDHTGHTGGVSHFDKFLYVTDNDGLNVYHLDDLLSGKDELVEIGTVPTFLDPAWCYIHGDYILAGTFYEPVSYETPEEQRLTTPAGDQNTSLITVFRLDATQPLGVDPTPVAAISTPDRVQGFCVTDTGEVALSTSWSINSSMLYLYDAEKLTAQGTFAVNGVEVPLVYMDSASLTRTVKAPPMAEGILCIDGRLYVLNESACNKYIFGKLLSGYGLYSYDLKED